jgi:phosphatidylserine/phosphatidylglycerophosphate/cardiolipin synthase-like enzyme
MYVWSPKIAWSLSLAVLLTALAAAPIRAAAPDLALSVDRNPIDVTRRAIAMAEESIAAVVYKFDDPSLLQELQRAAKRGVAIRLVADASEAADKNSLVHRAAKAGAKIRLWSVKRGKLHVKFAVFNGKEVLSGSYNWARSAAA